MGYERTDIVMIHPKTNQIVAVFDSINQASRVLNINRKYIAKALQSTDTPGIDFIECCRYKWDILLDPGLKVDNEMQDYHIKQAILSKRINF